MGAAVFVPSAPVPWERIWPRPPGSAIFGIPMGFARDLGVAAAVREPVTTGRLPASAAALALS